LRNLNYKLPVPHLPSADDWTCCQGSTTTTLCSTAFHPATSRS